ncbi:hypothetical protein AGMMS49982_09210 [Bacteroidia bacterium]|nr:hypothetical protein AGMMS49982_09210 [Bacteroidia bacterium]
MKKLFKFSVLSVLMLGFAACSSDDGGKPVYSIYDEPAVVESVGELPTIRTAYGKYSVASLANSTSVAEGSLLWVAFMFERNPSDKELPAAQGFKYFEIDSTKVAVPANAAEFEAYLSDSYSDSIELAMLYNTYIDSMLFFKFTQKAAENQRFDYELVCNPDLERDAQNIPTLYIRTKKVDGPTTRTSQSQGANTIFGIEMAEYIAYYKVRFAGEVKFHLKYKIGTDKDGKDVYRAFKSNPITWTVR